MDTYETASESTLDRDYRMACAGLMRLGWTIGIRGHVRAGDVVHAVRTYGGALEAVDALNSSLQFASAHRSQS